MLVLGCSRISFINLRKFSSVSNLVIVLARRDFDFHQMFFLHLLTRHMFFRLCFFNTYGVTSCKEGLSLSPFHVIINLFFFSSFSVMGSLLYFMNYSLLLLLFAAQIVLYMAIEKSLKWNPASCWHTSSFFEQVCIFCLSRYGPLWLAFFT